jgi:hypothetical protein
VIVIADTSGIIAASDRNALQSAACLEILQQAGTVVISPLVLTEVDHLAKARFGARARTTVIDFVLGQARQQRFQIARTGPSPRTSGSGSCLTISSCRTAGPRRPPRAPRPPRPPSP